MIFNFFFLKNATWSKKFKKLKLKIIPKYYYDEKYIIEYYYYYKYIKYINKDNKKNLELMFYWKLFDRFFLNSIKQNLLFSKKPSLLSLFLIILDVGLKLKIVPDSLEWIIFW